jgi:CBS domain-containing protein
MLANITVKQHMSTNLVTFHPRMDVYEAIRKLLEHRITGAPVVEQSGEIVGVFSEMDCLRIALSSTYYEGMGGKVGEYMTRNFKPVDADTSILEVAEMFTKTNMRHFPVVEDDRLIGVISRVDVLRAFLSIHH